MKFSVLSQNLAKGLSIAGKAISPRASLPILSNVLITNDKGMLKITATDLEKSVSTWVGAKIKQEGGITIPAKTLLGFVSNHPVSRLECKVEKNFLVLKSETVLSKFSGMDIAEFPQVYEKLAKDRLTVPSKDFLKAVSQVSFASAVGDSRPVLAGILTSFHPKGVSFVGVDGFRLAQRRLPVKNSLGNELSIIIPAKSLDEVARMLASSSETVTISYIKDEGVVAFEGDSIFITTRVLEGEFPDYEKIIPKENSYKSVLDKEGFIQALKLASVFSGGEARIVNLLFDHQAGKLRISAQSDEIGESTAVTPAKIEGENLETAFNSKFLLDFLGRVEGEEIVFESGGSLSPALLYPKGMKDYLYVVMPVKVSK